MGVILWQQKTPMKMGCIERSLLDITSYLVMEG
jgi:hypothetical protein